MVYIPSTLAMPTDAPTGRPASTLAVKLVSAAVELPALFQDLALAYGVGSAVWYVHTAPAPSMLRAESERLPLHRGGVRVLSTGLLQLLGDMVALASMWRSPRRLLLERAEPESEEASGGSTSSGDWAFALPLPLPLLRMDDFLLFMLLALCMEPMRRLEPTAVDSASELTEPMPSALAGVTCCARATSHWRLSVTVAVRLWVTEKELKRGCHIVQSALESGLPPCSSTGTRNSCWDCADCGVHSCAVARSLLDGSKLSTPPAPAPAPPPPPARAAAAAAAPPSGATVEPSDRLLPSSILEDACSGGRRTDAMLPNVLSVLGRKKLLPLSRMAARGLIKPLPLRCRGASDRWPCPLHVGARPSSCMLGLCCCTPETPPLCRRAVI